jgi:cysteine desulfurase/selenocysteine lyase
VSRLAAREDFPLLAQTLDERPITYLDSASTTPKPRAVIDAVVGYYERYGANVHRGVHPLGEQATEAYEQARYEVASLLNASPAEIIFVGNATDGINLVARSVGLSHDDGVLVPASEHHSNFLPWGQHGRPIVAPMDAEAVPRWDALHAHLDERPRLLAFAHVSNVTGAKAPAQALCAHARERGVLSLVDASQSISHMPVDVRALGCDFLVFSSHKIFGPNGVGVLYARRERLEALALDKTGGGMVSKSGEHGFVPREGPFRFEAGTPNIEGAIGLGAAIRYVRALGLPKIEAHSQALGAQLVDGLAAIPGARVLARSVPREERIALVTVSLPVPGLSQEGVARWLADAHGILVSGGYHCAHLLHDRVELAGTVRLSAHVFNDEADVAQALEALRELVG